MTIRYNRRMAWFSLFFLVFWIFLCFVVDPFIFDQKLLSVDLIFKLLGVWLFAHLLSMSTVCYELLESGFYVTAVFHRKKFHLWDDVPYVYITSFKGDAKHPEERRIKNIIFAKQELPQGFETKHLYPLYLAFRSNRFFCMGHTTCLEKELRDKFPNLNFEYRGEQFPGSVQYYPWAFKKEKKHK